LAHRREVSISSFRGVQATVRRNHEGWPDGEPRADARRRFVFVGDSFLEGSRNLAERVEARLNAAGQDADVVNLAKSDTGPPAYQHRFYEIALPMRPE